MQTPNSYRDYFANMVAGSSGNPNFAGGFHMNSFYYAESRRIIEAMRSEIIYPAMWLGVPSYTFGDNGAGNYIASPRGEIAIIHNAAIDDYVGIDAAISNTYGIVRRVMAALYADSVGINPQFNFNLNDISSLDPIQQWFTDNDYGWLMTFKLRNVGFFDICPTP